MSKLAVVCFYWIGDRWSYDGLGVKYINNLFRGVSRNLKREFDFICFTNEKLDGLDDGITVCPFTMISKRGVLPRMFMFSRESGLFGYQVLVLDLDIVIVGLLNDIAGYNGLFCTRSKFKVGEGHKLDGDIISFQAGEENQSRFWNPLITDLKAVEESTGGRERYWFREVLGMNGGDRWDALYPNQVVSYKRHVLPRRGSLPDNARIVSCHGHPRPHELDIKKNSWLLECWK